MTPPERPAYEFEGELWASGGPTSWHFVTVPGEHSDDIAARTQGGRRGFGSVRVLATVGGTSWETSLFPDRSRQAYLLPVKQAVRRQECLEAGDELRVSVALAG